MKLSKVAHGRENNFNLIRMVAAMAVLFSHSFAIAVGSGDAEPMRSSLGLTWGDVAVDVFFVTSGFLVCASLLSRRRAVDFVWARGLRIFPALWVMLMLTTFALGTYFTAQPLRSYLLDPLTWHYLVKNAILLKGIDYQLPGVFTSNPVRYAVNGSLWTLPYEVKIYAVLLLIWLVARPFQTYRLTAFKATVIGIAAAAGAIYLFDGFNFDYANNWPRLFFFFFSGAALNILKDYVPLSYRAFWLCAFALSISTIDRTAFFFAFNLTIAYLLVYAAYVFSGRIRAYNCIGDYSYGVYIYAFPVQQSVVAALPGVRVFELMGIAAALTVVIAIASWHLLERRALNLKDNFAEATKRLFRLPTVVS